MTEQTFPESGTSKPGAWGILRHRKCWREAKICR